MSVTIPKYKPNFMRLNKKRGNYRLKTFYISHSDNNLAINTVSDDSTPEQKKRPVGAMATILRRY